LSRYAVRSPAVEKTAIVLAPTPEWYGSLARTYEPSGEKESSW
jgi:hypothetical protein